MQWSSSNYCLRPQPTYVCCDHCSYDLSVMIRPSLSPSLPPLAYSKRLLCSTDPPLTSCSLGRIILSEILDLVLSSASVHTSIAHIMNEMIVGDLDEQRRELEYKRTLLEERFKLRVATAKACCAREAPAMLMCLKCLDAGVVMRLSPDHLHLIRFRRTRIRTRRRSSTETRARTTRLGP